MLLLEEYTEWTPQRRSKYLGARKQAYIKIIRNSFVVLRDGEKLTQYPVQNSVRHSLPTRRLARPPKHPDEGSSWSF